jgi:NADH:ubiquinone oxidoreductase subunit 6 (subunit J)
MRVMSSELGFGLLALLLVIIPATRVVACRDLVRGVLWLAATLLGTAVLYALLHAPFLAGVQVLTYVGGVVTLMIFGVMVTRKHEASTFTIDGTGRLRGALAALAFFFVVAAAVLRTDLSSLIPVDPPSTQDLAFSLLDRYLLAFEVASVLLLAAIVSAVVLARRRDPAPAPAATRGAAALREGSTP